MPTSNSSLRVSLPPLSSLSSLFLSLLFSLSSSSSTFSFSMSLPFPSMSSKMVIFLSLLVFLVGNGDTVHSIEHNKVLTLQKFRWNNQPSSCIYHKPRIMKGATILEMKHRDFCLERRKFSDWIKNLQKRLILDDLHVQALQSRFKNIASVNTRDYFSNTHMPLTSGIILETLNYIVTIQLGGQNMSVIVDTGSDITWVQCEPCKLCYSQKDPLFNPSKSSSYKSVFCNSSACETLASETGNSGQCGINSPTCNYVVDYVDGSFTRGDLGLENLHLGSTEISNFVFGCGKNNKGLFGGASGLLGLAKSDISVVSQTLSLFGGVFSYCLPSTEAGSSGDLIMGTGDYSAFKNFTPISYTKIVHNPQLSNFYFLNVTGISVGGVSLESPRFGKNGVLIDSGTVITRLNPSIYKALREEFLKQFSGFPTAEGFSILNTCFNLSAYEEVNIPTVKFHFEGNAEMVVDVTGVFYFVKSDSSQMCLAIASLLNEEEIGIIGNYQQKNQRVVYDVKESQLGFAGESCSFV